MLPPAASSTNVPVTITVVETAPVSPRARRPRLILTKRRGPGPDDQSSYDKAQYFLFRVVPAADIQELFVLLCGLALNPHAATIRGVPLPGIDLNRPQRRLIHRQAGIEPTIAVGQPVGWAAFDLDKSAPPAGIDWRAHPREAAWAILQRDLPSWVTEADLVAYWSSGQGFSQNMKLRIFVLLERPLISSDLKALMRPLVESGGGPVDLALYNDAQLHYTATPLFTGCVADPLPSGRHYLFEGRRRRAVAPPIPTGTVPPRSSPTPGVRVQQTYTETAPHLRKLGGRGGSANPRIVALIESMGDGEGKQGFHLPWNRALAIFYVQNGPDADPLPLIAKLRRRMLECGSRDADYVERETLGMIRRARVLAALERERHDGQDVRLKTAASILRAEREGGQ